MVIFSSTDMIDKCKKKRDRNEVFLINEKIIVDNIAVCLLKKFKSMTENSYK